ncbi:hypothetical protein LAZ40_09530 [Cereibacter sphaeroides]|uniref:hypothetical protein n=1 Tax=Cereibacter sphaeroides TaxID=1063 RepID=UPI001F46916B|nr:hypothetical protein [Cereibacter sphaeroides]MCE6959293.1 hypothetical protein [Cereibacter sphaeroides]MCE6972885.1 hypothetical protein [Cereibacter sphaeroides]
MNTDTTHMDALAHDPDAVRLALADLNRKLRRRGEPAVAAVDCDWSYSWCIGFGFEPEPGRSNIGANLVASYGRLSGRSRLSEPGKTLRLDRIPPEIDAARNPPRVTPENTAHIAAVPMMPNPAGEVRTLLVTGGYRKDGEFLLIGAVTGDPVGPPASHFVHVLTPHGARFVGGLVATARERYDATPEGGTFTWRNKRLRRLTREAILARLQPAPEGDGPEPS